MSSCKHRATPPELGAALRSFAAVVRAVDEVLVAELAGSDEAAKRFTEQAETAAFSALRAAGRCFPRDPRYPLS
jgi:hypothetical protein